MYAARDTVIASSGVSSAPAPVADLAVDASTGTVTVTEGSVVGEVSGSSGAVTVVGGGSTGSGVIVGTVDTVVPGSTPMVISAPIDTAMPEPVTVTLTSVRLGTTQVWDADGTVWLLPAYVFSGTDTGDVTVIAVDEAYLDIPEVPVPDVMPPVSAPPALGTIPPDSVLVDPMPEAVDPAAAAVLVGLGEDEAARVAESNGWTLRSARIDGVEQALTDDLQWNRINIAVDAGIVTEILFVG
jgi:hypothetical protein